MFELLWQVFREPHFDFGNWGLFFFGFAFLGFLISLVFVVLVTGGL